MWCVSGRRTGMWLALGIGVMVAEAQADKRSRGGWSQNYYQQGGSIQYYQTTDGRLYYLGTDGRTHWYQPPTAAAPTVVQNQNRADAQSGCTHGPDGSECKHRYDVNHNYQVSQNQKVLGAGNINYRGGRDNNYVHQGSAEDIARVDRGEQKYADKNTERAKSLAGDAKLKAALESIKIRFEQSIQNGTIPAAARQAGNRVIQEFDRAIDLGAQADQEDDPARERELDDQTLDAIQSAVELAIAYGNQYEWYLPTHARNQKTLTEVLVLIRLAKALR